MIAVYHKTATRAIEYPVNQSEFWLVNALTKWEILMKNQKSNKLSVLLPFLLVHWLGAVILLLNLTQVGFFGLIPVIGFGLIAAFWFLQRRLSNAFFALTFAIMWLGTALRDYALPLTGLFIVFFTLWGVISIKEDRKQSNQNNTR